MTSRSRGIIIAGNWKMNHGFKETKEFFEKLEKFEINAGSAQICIFPSFPLLEKATTYSKKLTTPIHIGAQNAHGELKGAFTGEVSGPMLKELGVNWILLGHSERRQFFGETNEGVQTRAKGLLTQGFQVMICIGENKQERESGKTDSVLEKQIQNSLNPAMIKHVGKSLSLAYEPIWAIGTGLTATPEQAEEAHQMIRRHLKKHFSSEAADKMQILYGGSVTPENSKTLLACQNVDGLLIGGASLDAEKFGAILKSAHL